MSICYGMLHFRTSNQNHSVTSLTEDGLIGTSEYFPFNLWMVMFMEAQGYDIKKNIFFRDNQITIRMAKNGRSYCTVNSRYINISHFFVKDRVDKG